jgi:hypothetical protein
MKHADLFDTYQSKLQWIDRRLTPDCLKIYEDTAESWKHAKEVAFSMYQELRLDCEDGIPSLHDCLIQDEEKVRNTPPYRFENGYECRCHGIIHYRDHDFPLYTDDYGMSEFIVFEGNEIQVSSIGGECDWYYPIDLILDKIY